MWFCSPNGWAPKMGSNPAQIGYPILRSHKVSHKKSPIASISDGPNIWGSPIQFPYLSYLNHMKSPFFVVKKTRISPIPNFGTHAPWVPQLECPPRACPAPEFGRTQNMARKKLHELSKLDLNNFESIWEISQKGQLTWKKSNVGQLIFQKRNSKY